MKKTIFILLCLVAILYKSAEAYDDIDTHRRLTSKALENSRLESYIITNMSISTGFTTRLPQQSNRTIAYLVTEGAKMEDDELCRRSAHFLNPIQSWDVAGLSSSILATFTCTSLYLNLTNNANIRYSALTLATGLIAPSKPPIYIREQEMGWGNARTYFYSALTGKIKESREVDLANAFLAMGQVLHLLQDMGVPAHVRDDFMNSHVWTGGANPYENYAKSRPDLIRDMKQKEVMKPLFSSSMAVSDFWDANVMPEAMSSVALQGRAGFAEYTNANFVSEGTLFTSSTVTEYPQKSSTETVVHEISDPFILGTTVKRPYYYKTKDWEVSYHLAGVNYTFFYMPESGLVSPDIIVPPLDRYVHEDYAAKLLPRAVGYSAALIDYFFRGQLGVSFAPKGIRVKNLSKEDMTSYQDPATGDNVGAISVYFDDSKNERHLLQTYDLATSDTPVLKPGQESGLISFNTPTVNIKNNRYIIAFKGKLGNEDGAVVGRVYVPTIYYFSRIDNVDKIARVEMDGSNSTIVADSFLNNLFLGRFSLSPDGNAIVFMNLQAPGYPNGNILHLDLMTGNSTWLAEGNNPDWSPDGTKIVYSRDLQRVGGLADEQIFTLDLASGIETQLTNTARSGHYDPVWSPDGTRIAFSRSNSKSSDCTNDITINIMTAAGDMITPVTCAAGTAYVDREPTWSPDGKAIAFVRRTEGGTTSQLHRATLTTMQAVITQLTTSNVVDRAPAWSPDGSSIAIGTSLTADGNYDVHLVNAQTGAFITNLTASNSGSDSLPVFGK